MAANNLNDSTVTGLLAYCDWLRDKGYQSDNAIEAWKTAIKKVFETVEPESYEQISVENLDLDDYVNRFRTLAGADYKAETITVYAKRIRNAIEAHDYYREHGRPPSFRKPAKRAKDDSRSGSKSASKNNKVDSREAGNGYGENGGQLVRFPFPLRSGQMAELKLPPRLEKIDADRLAGFLRALQFEPQQQIPERTGEAEKEAA
jgi:hypothetical protein